MLRIPEMYEQESKLRKGCYIGDHTRFLWYGLFRGIPGV